MSHFDFRNLEEREREERRKKRKSRWNGSEHDKTFIPGMPTILPCTLNKDQEQAYLRKYHLLAIFLIFINYRSTVFIFCPIFYFTSNQTFNFF